MGPTKEVDEDECESESRKDVVRRIHNSGRDGHSEVTAIAVVAVAGASIIEEIMTILPIGLPQTAEGAFLCLLFFCLRACVQYARSPHSHALKTAIN